MDYLNVKLMYIYISTENKRSLIKFSSVTINDSEKFHTDERQSHLKYGEFSKIRKTITKTDLYQVAFFVGGYPDDT